MVPAATRAPPAGKAAGTKRKSGSAVAVSREACRALADCVAFFRASRFRDAAPGDCREDDRCAAEAMIRATLRKLRKRSP
jgi:hypothetical protein